MKNTILAIALFMSYFSSQAQIFEDSVTFDENAPVFEFENEVINYGKIEQNADGNRFFVFKNIGNSPLVISNVKGSCGCTVPTSPKEPIMPGATDSIKVKYATNRVGRFSKSVTITSNASEPKKIVRIKGEVLAKEEEKEEEKGS